MPLLKKGAIVGSDVSGECYKVTSGRIAEGGFGEIYRGALLDGRRDPRVLRQHRVAMDRRLLPTRRRLG